MAIALSGSLILSGSITVSGSIISTGTISMSGSIASASYATNADLLDGLDSTVFTLTSSFAAQTASFTAFTASINSFSASILAQTASLNSFSSSVLTFTGSAATRLGALEAATASLYTTTGSQNTRLGALEAATASLYTTTSSLNAFSASLNSYTSSTDAKIVSIYSTTSSLNTRVGTLEAYTSSLNNKTSSFATTGSNIFIGTQTITGSVLQSGSFTSTGTLTAQTLVVQTITSSVVYSSGSNIFGNSIGNTQIFTGSLSVTGSTASFAGNVGIGTTVPNTLLSLVGNHVSGQGILKIQSATAYSSSGLASISLNDSDGVRKAIVYSNADGLQLETSASIPLLFNPGGTTKMTILSGGSVGIGTTNPTNKLVVQGGASFRGGTNVTQANYNDSGSTVDIVVDNQQPKIYSSYWSGTEKNLYLGTYSQQSLLVLTTGGNVGIGTTAPSSKLNVNGNIGFAGDTDKLFYMPDIYQGTGSIFMQAGFASAAAGGALKLYGHNATTYTGGDVEVGLSSKGNFLINSYIGGTRLVTVKVDGTVGIGTTSPDERLTVGAGNGISIRTANSGTYGALKFGTNNAAYAADWAGIDSDWEGVGVNVSNLRFYTSYGAISEKMRISAGGNVGIGTTSPAVKLDIRGTSAGTVLDLLQVQNESSSANSGASISLKGYYNAAKIIGVTQDASFDYSAYLAFQVNNPSNTMTERMRITSGGFTKMSNTGTYQDAALYHELRVNTSGNWVIYMTNTASTDPYGMIIRYTGASPNGSVNEFFYAYDTGGARFGVRSNGGIANYQANDVNLSDIRTKKDIAPLESYWDKFKAIEIVKFKYKDQTHDDFNIGVIAQQVEEIAPEFVDVDGFGETPEDGIPYKTIYTADLYHTTIKVLQEAITKIETLQARVQYLENK